MYSEIKLKTSIIEKGYWQNTSGNGYLFLLCLFFFVVWDKEAAWQGTMNREITNEENEEMHRSITKAVSTGELWQT